MIHAVLIYLIVIVYHAFLVIPFKAFTPNELVKMGYLTWTDSFTYVNSTIDGLIYSSNLTTQKKYKYRIDIILCAYFRWLCNNPHKLEDHVARLKRQITDTNSINPSAFYELKKKGKISL